MRYCIVLDDGSIIDLDDYNVFWLEDDEIEEMRETVPNDYIFDAALMYHTARINETFKNLENG
jgi:hypothetical protein